MTFGIEEGGIVGFVCLPGVIAMADQRFTKSKVTTAQDISANTTTNFNFQNATFMKPANIQSGAGNQNVRCSEELEMEIFKRAEKRMCVVQKKAVEIQMRIH